MKLNHRLIMHWNNLIAWYIMYDVWSTAFRCIGHLCLPLSIKSWLLRNCTGSYCKQWQDLYERAVIYNTAFPKDKANLILVCCSKLKYNYPCDRNGLGENDPFKTHAW